ACPVVGDIKSTMKMFNDGLATHDIHASKEWTDMLTADTQKNDARFGGKETEPTDPMNNYTALGAIEHDLSKNRDVIVTNEGANALDDCRDIVNIYEPRHRLDCGTWGVMGIGLPYAIAAAVETGKSVVSIHGDSAFGFDGMEVETICRYKLPVTIVMLNNGGIYRGDFENLGDDGDPSPLTLDPVAHYDRMIEAFGGKGYFATTQAEVEQYLAEAIASRQPALINIQLSVHSGTESGHISYLNPLPAIGPLADSECEDLDEKIVDGKLVQGNAS
ncbi:MAG: thiamine pyrophosphate-dependent enzyme, partial [Eggerthellaceae bacterium]|nr:thiamine pyrophosphate-dependent enzyme [Eggerthellaceae bacterium]